MVKVVIYFIPQGITMWENIRMGSQKVKVNILGVMEQYIQVILKMG
jgi:hypothetical protein